MPSNRVNLSCYAHLLSFVAGSNPRKGDALVLAGATLYAVSNVSEVCKVLCSFGFCSSTFFLFSFLNCLVHEASFCYHVLRAVEPICCILICYDLEVKLERNRIVKPYLTFSRGSTTIMGRKFLGRIYVITTCLFSMLSKYLRFFIESRTGKHMTSFSQKKVQVSVEKLCQ